MKSKLTKSTVLCWSFIILFIVFYTTITIFKYISYSYDDFDVAIDSQTLYNLLHGDFTCSIHRIVFLGNHMRLILLLLAPIYFFFPSAYTLIFIQIVILSLGGWAIFLITRKILNQNWGVIFCILFLLSPLVGYLVLYEFHPTALAVTFILFSLYYYLEKKFLKFCVFMFLSISCQENIPLIYVMLGFYSAFKKYPWKKWVLFPVVFNLSYFVLSTKFIMPHFNKGTLQFFMLYSHLGSNFSSILKNIILHPLKVLKICLEYKKLIFLFQLFFPLGFLSFIKPSFLLVGSPIFFQHLLSLNPRHTEIIYHYQAEHIPFIFISAIFGISFLFSMVLAVCTSGYEPYTRNSSSFSFNSNLVYIAASSS